MPAEKGFASVFDYFTRWEMSLPPAYHHILTERNSENSKQFLSKLPASISTLWGYEFRLAELDLEADFQICISDASYWSFYDFLSTNPFGHEIWKRFQTLVSRWVDVRDPVHSLIQNIWLEMDAEQMRSELPVPNFFFGPIENLKTSDFLNVVCLIFSVLGIEVGEGERLTICKIHSSLPKGAWIQQVGKMSARPGKQPIRLFINDISKDELTPFLRIIGYQFNWDILNALVEELYHIFDFINVNVETEFAQRKNKIGLEGYVYQWDRWRLQNALSYFSKNGLLDDRYRERLNAYFDACNRKEYLHKEFIHHFKISYSSTGSLEIKLYVGVARTIFGKIR